MFRALWGPLGNNRRCGKGERGGDGPAEVGGKEDGAFGVKKKPQILLGWHRSSENSRSTVLPLVRKTRTARSVCLSPYPPPPWVPDGRTDSAGPQPRPALRPR